MRQKIYSSTTYFYYNVTYNLFLLYRHFSFVGTENGAGTDANVFIELVGSLSSTLKLPLSKSSTNMNKFENGQRDEFSIPLEVCSVELSLDVVEPSLDVVEPSLDVVEPWM